MAIRLTAGTSRVDYGDVVLANTETGDQGAITVFLDIRPTGALSVSERMFHKWGNSTATRVFVLGVSAAFTSEIQFTLSDGVGLWGHRTSGLGFTSGRRYRIVASISGIGSGALTSQFWVNGREYPTVSVFASNCAFVSNNATSVLLGYEPITPTNGVVGDYAAAALWHSRAPLPTAIRQSVSAGRSPAALRSLGGFFYATLGNDTVAHVRNRWDFDGTGAGTVPTSTTMTGGGLAERRGRRKRYIGAIPEGGGSSSQAAFSTPATVLWMTAAATATPGARTATSTPTTATWTVPAATATPGVRTATTTTAIATWTAPAATAIVTGGGVVSTPASATWTAPAATAIPAARPASSTPALATWATVPATARGVVGTATTPAVGTWTTATATATAGATLGTSAPATAVWTAPPSTAVPGAALTLAVAPVLEWLTVPARATDRPIPTYTVLRVAAARVGRASLTGRAGRTGLTASAGRATIAARTHLEEP